MQIEAAALEKETSEESKERLHDLKRQIAEREESTNQLKVAGSPKSRRSRESNRSKKTSNGCVQRFSRRSHGLSRRC
jgi:hypothetical protein